MRMNIKIPELHTNPSIHAGQHDIPANFSNETFDNNCAIPFAEENVETINQLDDKATQLFQSSGSISKTLKTSIKKTIASNELGAVIILQLVGQRQLIELFGSQIGNTSIELVKSLITNCLRLEDYVEQISEDELAIVLGNLEASTNAELVAQRILEKCEGTHSKNGQSLYIMATISIAAIS